MTRANYRLEYVDLDGRYHDVLIITEATARARFQEAVSKGFKPVILYKRNWQELLSLK